MKFFLLMTIYHLPFTINCAWAQFEFQMGITPEAMDYNQENSTTPAKRPIDPFAQTLSDELSKMRGDIFWEKIGLSTSAPAQDLSRYVRRGFGRSELITLMFIAEQGTSTLKDLTLKRLQGGRLRELAVEQKLPYDTLRLEANAMKEGVVSKMKLKPKEDPPVISTDSPHPSPLPKGEGEKRRETPAKGNEKEAIR